MIKVKDVRVCGLDSMVKAVRIIRGGESDSYWTHIGDGDTLETAKYEYFVGEKDLEEIRSCVEFDDVLMEFAVAYIELEAPEIFWERMDWRILCEWKGECGVCIMDYAEVLGICAQETDDEDLKEFQKILRELPYFKAIMEG